MINFQQKQNLKGYKILYMSRKVICDIKTKQENENYKFCCIDHKLNNKLNYTAGK
jgi:hypothetical protein